MLKILSATVQILVAKTRAALVLTDIHLIFKMVHCKGTDSCYLHRPSPCNWLQFDTLNCNNIQLAIRFKISQFFSVLHQRGVWKKKTHSHPSQPIHSGCPAPSNGITSDNITKWCFLCIVKTTLIQTCCC